ncbi:MAG: hypothetical protein V1891_04675 [bacterium]
MEINKKQKIALWATGILIFLSILFPLTAKNRAYPEEIKSFMFEQLGVFFIVGIVAFFYLKDKNKEIKDYLNSSFLKFLILMLVLGTTTIISLVYMINQQLRPAEGRFGYCTGNIFPILHSTIPLNIGINLAIILPVLTFFYTLYTKHQGIVYTRKSIIVITIILTFLCIIFGYEAAYTSKWISAVAPRECSLNIFKANNLIVAKEVLFFIIKPILFAFIMFMLHKWQVSRLQRGSIFKKILVSFFSIILGGVMVIGLEIGFYFLSIFLISPSLLKHIIF